MYLDFAAIDGGLFYFLSQLEDESGVLKTFGSHGPGVAADGELSGRGGRLGQHPVKNII